MTSEFWSPDARYGVYIPDGVAETIRSQTSASGRSETGGILIGRYSSDLECAVVEEIGEPPPDSLHRPWWFIRGVEGIQEQLDVLWENERGYYLGEWHYHPGEAPIPSRCDLHQMRSIAESNDYRCPEPILLIVGEKVGGELQYWVSVTVRGEGTLPLVQRKPVVPVAKVLNYASATLGITWKNIAKALGVSARTIRRWRAGNSNPNRKNRLRLDLLYRVLEYVHSRLRDRRVAQWLESGGAGYRSPLRVFAEYNGNQLMRKLGRVLVSEGPSYDRGQPKTIR